MSFAKRFEQALNNAKSIRAFHEEISDTAKWGKVPGSSYSKIHRYLRGKDTPPVEFIEKAAEILRVRPTWLRSGEGEPTEIEEKVEAAQDEDPTDKLVKELLERMATEHPAFRQVRPWAYRVFLEAAVRLTFHRVPPSRGGAELGALGDLRDASATIAELIQQPLRYIDAPDLSADEASDYVASMCQTFLRLTAPRPFRGQPPTEESNS